MIDFKQHTTNLPSTLLKGLRPYLLLEFYDYPYLTVDTNNTGTLYLNYYLSGKDDVFNHILIEISQERLKMLLAGDYTLKQAFDSPEQDIIYHAQYNRAGQVIDLGIIELALFNELNPILADHEIDYEYQPETETVDLQIKSVQRGRILVDVYLQANSLKSSLKYWAIKSFLIPFSELVRTSLLNQSSKYTSHNLDKSVNLGINRFAISSLASTIELNYNSDLFGNSEELENIANLFLVLNAKDEDTLLKSFDNFPQKKIISEYIKVLNVIIKNDATLNTKIAAPNNYFSETFITKTEAQALKKIINEKIPNVEDTEEIQGYLLELSFDKTSPTFSMSASLEELKYKGRIDEALVKRISEIEFTFLTKEYLFTIHTLYVPETSKSPEKITRTLTDITEISE
ncbi:MAG: hypothetical protein IM604_05535 [Cytophagales bacterium]|jgi:hypothetical protein|nr:hypothetical protein [Cytophagales bacterium]